MKKGIQSIVIAGKRWFDKANGNTYHSVKVFVNGELVGDVPVQYGYADQYIQTAHELLQEVGLYPKTKDASKDYYVFQNDIRKHRNKFVITVADVGRKRDL